MNKLKATAEIKSVDDATEGRGTRMTVRLSRTSTDRDGETIRATGWKVPTGTVNVLVNHDNRVECVVGKLIRTWVDGDAYMGEIEYADNVPENTLARFVVAMHKSGQLGPVSVGFMPEKWIDPDGKTYTRQNPGPYWGSLPGREYVEQELLELSEVAVGSHRDAMVLVSRAFGITPEAPAPVEPAPTNGEPEKQIEVDWLQKFLGSTPSPKASDPDAPLSREQSDRLTEAENAVEAARKAVAELRSAMRADQAV